MSNLMENNNFARVLRAERKRLEMTQAQLAEAIGTSQQNIGGMERGLSLPRPELHDKMVELFGKDSPVANLPPRRDVLIPGASAEVIARASSGVMSRISDGAQMIAFSRKQEVLPPASASGTVNRRERNAGLADLLPPELRPNVEKRLAMLDMVYRVDYLSDKLCVEIKTPQHITTVLAASRLGMQQLTIFMKGLSDQGATGSPKPILLLVKGDMDLWSSPNNNPRGKTVLLEASLLGIRPVMVETMADAAKYIAQAESEGSTAPVEAVVEDDGI